MTKPGLIRVLDPGMLTTVQDLGRPGWTHLGVPRGGACDSLSLRVGNRLVGNEDGAAALEMNLVGGSFEFLCDTFVVLSGGQANGKIDGSSDVRSISSWEPTAIRSGETLSVGPIRQGARCYLCIAGGLLVPEVLDSRSTLLSAKFGGVSGRSLKKGDSIEFLSSANGPAGEKSAHHIEKFCKSELARRTFRATEGAHYDCFDASAREDFWSSAFTVLSQSDRVGLRLDRKISGLISGAQDGRMPSEGMMHGAVQVPESGKLIVLIADHPTTGGYPVIACVAAVDHPALGQVAANESIRFERIGIEEARALFLEQEKRLDNEVPRHE